MNAPHSSDHCRPAVKYSQPEAIILLLCGLMLGAVFGYILGSRNAATPASVTNQEDVRLVIVGEIVLGQDGRYLVRRDRSDSPPTALDVYVRNNLNDHRWGYVFIGTVEQLALWQKVETNFFPVHRVGLADRYRPDFGPIHDPNRGFMTQTEDGLTFRQGIDGAFLPHWRVVYLPDSKEG